MNDLIGDSVSPSVTSVHRSTGAHSFSEVPATRVESMCSQNSSKNWVVVTRRRPGLHSRFSSSEASYPGRLSALIAMAVIVLLLFPGASGGHNSGPGLAKQDRAESQSSKVTITLQAFNSQQVSDILASALPFLTAGDTIVLGRHLPNDTPDIVTLDHWAEELAPHLPAGVELAALVEGLPNVQDAAQNLSPLFQSITVDYEPDPTFFPSWTWNFTVAVSYYEQAANLCHEFARQLMAYPSGRPLLEGDLQQYAWDYGVFGQAANSIDVETQGYTNGSKWSAAMTKLTDQLNQTDVPLNHLTVQLSFGSGGNGVNESTVIQDVRVAYALSVTGDFLFWTLQDSAWLVPILAAIENNSLSDSLVTFTESGLVNGTSWSVELNGDLESSTATTIVFSEAEGTFAFTIGPVSGFSASPYRGQLTVDGNATYQAVDFAPTQGSSYPVLVTESQLPSSTEWWANVSNGSSPESSTRSISLSEPNGSYMLTPASSNKSWGAVRQELVVAGQEIDVPIVFYEVTFLVTVTEQGLPTGTAWSVAIGGSTIDSSESNVSIAEPNGTYGLSPGAVTGFVLNGNASTSINVAGHQVTVLLSFVPARIGTTGSPPWLNWENPLWEWLLIGLGITSGILLILRRFPPAGGPELPTTRIGRRTHGPKSGPLGRDGPAESNLQSAGAIVFRPAGERWRP